MKKNIISGAIAVSMIASYPLSAYAADKEEVVYAMTKADGSVDSIYVVNSFDGGEITDYGEYSDVRLMNVDGEILKNGDVISFISPENKKAFYEGTLSKGEIPWNISIRYFLDGKELSAKEAAGKSGSLEIRISVSENENCKSDFYRNYALQCNFTLDTDICRNISAEGATVANVGSKKQITFTALAGSGLDSSIKADVTDFEMPSAQINGIRMELGLDVDADIDVNEVVDGVKKLDDGANGLHDGAVELNGGVSDLNAGIGKLRDGIEEAKEGLSELSGKSAGLTGGSAQVKNALLTIQKSLSEVSESTEEIERLVSASAQIKVGIDELCDGISKLKGAASYESYKSALGANGLDVDGLTAKNQQVIEQLSAQISELCATLSQIQNVPQYAEQAEQLSEQIKQLESIVQLLSGNNALAGATETYFGAVSQSAEKLYEGAKALSESYAEFDKGLNELADYLKNMLVDMSELKGGIDALSAEYAKLDGGISAYTGGVDKLYEGFGKISDGAKELAEGGYALADGTAQLVDGTNELTKGTGEFCDKTSEIDSASAEKLNDVIASMKGDYKTVSFVSEKNTEVSSVQFVITTEAIEIPEAEIIPEETEEKLSFWQKLLRLFGLY